MKNSGSIIVPILQLSLGLLAIVSFFTVMANGEDIKKWILTLVLAAVFVVLGAVGTVRRVRQK